MDNAFILRRKSELGKVDVKGHVGLIEYFERFCQCATKDSKETCNVEDKLIEERLVPKMGKNGKVNACHRRRASGGSIWSRSRGMEP